MIYHRLKFVDIVSCESDDNICASGTDNYVHCQFLDEKNHYCQLFDAKLLLALGRCHRHGECLKATAKIKPLLETHDLEGVMTC